MYIAVPNRKPHYKNLHGELLTELDQCNECNLTAGHSWDWVNGICSENWVEPPICALGYHLLNGVCIPDIALECEYGYHLDSNGNCVINDCPTGYHRDCLLYTSPSPRD